MIYTERLHALMVPIRVAPPGRKGETGGRGRKRKSECNSISDSEAKAVTVLLAKEQS